MLLSTFISILNRYKHTELLFGCFHCMENVREFLNNVVTNIREFFRSPSSPRTLALIALVILAIALPVTVVVLQQQTQLRQSAHFDNCPINEEVCGNNSEVSNWCSGKFASTSLVHITTNSNCGGSQCTEVEKNATQCGYQPPIKCPSNSPSGSFCTAAGICKGEAPDYYISASCGGGQVCCSPVKKVTYTCTNPNDPNNRGIRGSDGGTISCDTFSFCKGGSYTSSGSDLGGAKSALCANTSSCQSGNHVFLNAAGKYQLTSDATCAKYNCGNGYASIGGSCSFADSTCCIPSKEYGAKIQYHCINQNNFDYTAVAGTDGNVAYCGTLGSPANSFCTGGPVSTDNGIADALKQLCQTFNPSSCTCASNNNPSNTAFTCNNGLINRGCGTGLVCNTNAAGAQSGLWPCVKPLSTAKTVTCGNNNLGVCVFIDMSSGSNITTTTDPARAEAYDKQSDLPSCNKINSSYTGIYDNGVCSSQKNKYGQPQKGEGPMVSECCMPAKPSSPAACQAVGGYCGNFGDACKGGYEESYGALSCGSGTVCCVPQPSCSDVNGYCLSYSSGGNCKDTYAPNSTYTGCSNAICCIPTTGKNPTDCSSLNGTCVTAGKSCPSNYEVNNLGEKSCGTGNVCCIPKSGSGGTGTPKPTCDPSTENCNGGGPTPPPCTNGHDTKLAISVKLDGIGTNTYENSNPTHPNRTGKVRVFDTSNSSGSINGSSQAFNFGKNDGKFDGATIDVGNKLNCSASYKVEVRLPGYLPASADVKYGDTTQVISLEPLGGDINQVDNNGVIVGDGKIWIEDYSIYRQCRNQDPTTPIDFKSDTADIQVKCGDLINFYDFQDGGTMESNIFAPSGIGEWDANYNLWLRSYIKANGY